MLFKRRLSHSWCVKPVLIVILLLGIIAAAASAAPLSTVVNRKVSAEVRSQGGIYGDNNRYQISPDGAYAVYIDYQFSSPYLTGGELYSVRLDGSIDPVRLSYLLPVGTSVFDFKISPNSDRVVYRVDQDVQSNVELYSVSINGGDVTKLNRPLVAEGDVTQFQIDPSGLHVVYRADALIDDQLELFTVPISGGSSLQLSGPLVSEGDVRGFDISPTGSHVVYRASQLRADQFELFTVPISGGTATRINAPLIAGGNVDDFEISPDGTRVVYIADQVIDFRIELFSTPISGGAVTKLNSVLALNGSITEFEISSNSARVVYKADQLVNGKYELFSVSIGGGDVTKLSGELAPAADVWKFQSSPDSARVVYIAQNSALEYELYSTPITGGNPTKLNDPLVAGGGVLSFQISPDSGRVAYRADQNTDGKIELFSVSINGGPVSSLMGEVDLSGFNFEVVDFEISPDSGRVVYLIDFLQRSLVSVPINGGEITRLNGDLVTNGGVNSFLFSPDGSSVVYQADQDVFFLYELYISYVNEPPRFSTLVAPDATLGTPYYFKVHTSDPNPERLHISAVEKPDWLILTDHGDGTATLSGTPDPADRGNHTVQLRVTDTSGAADEITLSIEIDNATLFLPTVTR